MRTIDMLDAANRAPRLKIRLDRILSPALLGVCIAACAMALSTVLITAFLGIMPAATMNLMLLCMAPAMSFTVIWPLCLRNRLDRLRMRREPAGLIPFVFSNILAFGVMKTIGSVVVDGHSPLYLTQLLIVPIVLDLIARDARRSGWIQDADAEQA